MGDLVSIFDPKSPIFDRWRSRN